MATASQGMVTESTGTENTGTENTGTANTSTNARDSNKEHDGHNDVDEHKHRHNDKKHSECDSNNLKEHEPQR